jgi:predicted Zn-dependent protease
MLTWFTVKKDNAMRLRCLLRLLFMLPLGLLAGCEETPTGRSQLALVPENLMAQMGEDAFDQLRQRRPISGDAAINRRVQVVAAAEAIYPAINLPKAWEVAVFEDPSPNAFALPGGRIGVHTGLLRVAETPAQLGISLPFSRAHEEEADLMGLAIMARAGFDPQQSVALWRNMAAAGSGQPPEFLSTHPAHGSRIEALQQAMEDTMATYRAATPADCSG